MMRRRKRSQPSKAFTPTLSSLLSYPELMIQIHLYLNLKDILVATQTSSALKDILDDDVTWEIRCRKLLQGKVNIPTIIFDHLNKRRGKDAMREAIKYERQRHITEEQITSSRWYFRKKQCSCASSATCTDSAVQIREIGSDGMVYEHSPCGKRLKCDIDGRPMTWRLVNWIPTVTNSRLEYSVKKHGSYLRVGWLPTMHVSRHSNWGFILENLWSVATNFQTDSPAQDIPNNITISQQSIEVMLCGLGLSLPIAMSEGKTLLRRFRWILREKLGLVVGDGTAITSDDTVDYDSTEYESDTSDDSSDTLGPGV
eukprot:TRINITY_DN10536_c0_g1_i1.p1 TRINITY_DN10536_c0_g1~~TRINITY_DN10536_c0_g1_i1.p1  ORF type:complete len:313 (+),score=34.30 TRINITY_DN10536_c0_g1_i1:82-1020(+)